MLSIPGVSTAPTAERDRVISTIILGFASDPLTRWFWPEASTYMRTAPAFDAFGGGSLDAGTAFVTDNFEGAALWMPPGSHSDEEGFAGFLEENSPADVLEDAFAVLGKMDEYHPHEECWYLPLIAVDPAHQGKGYGAALMNAALERVDADGLPAYLESSNPRNISLYLRHGFEVMGEIQIGTSPLVTPMLRPAQ